MLVPVEGRSPGLGAKSGIEIAQTHWLPPLLADRRCVLSALAEVPKVRGNSAVSAIVASIMRAAEFEQVHQPRATWSHLRLEARPNELDLSNE